MAEILVFAGPNGSGKSTVTLCFETVGQYVNADEIQKSLRCDGLKAAQIAQATREYFVDNMMDFTFETVMSTPRNINLLKSAKDKGYRIVCIYVLTVSPEINVSRVKQRVDAGGHGVPEEKIRARYSRALKLIPSLLQICDKLIIFDNSVDNKPNSNMIVCSEDGSISVYPNEIWSLDMIAALLDGEYIDAYLKQ